MRLLKGVQSHMSSLTMTDVLISLLPSGAIWELDESGDLYNLLDGSGTNHTTIHTYLKTLAFLREPRLTPILQDLEKEYGFFPNTSLTEAERREYLHGVAYAPASTGTWEYLEEQLQAAGFAVQVHTNSPAVDPSLFYGGAGGELMTNNILYERSFIGVLKYPLLWSYVFFIGGNDTRAADGSLTAIAPVIIADDLRTKFRELVLKYRPVHSWPIAVINNSDYFMFATADQAEAFPTTQAFSDDDQTTGGYWWRHDLG